MKKKVIYAILMVSMLTLCFGCKKKKKEENTPPVTPEVTNTPVPTKEVTPTPEEETHVGQVRSKLTGEWVNKEVENKRPYAIMLNNISYANPQSGTSEASIIYEAIVEGGITRMMGIYEDLYDEEGKSLSRIGSTRSARHYFVSFADEYDAIYVHYGQTKYAVSKMKELDIDTLSGLSSLGTTVFFRDNNIKAPHNAFASAKGILKGTKKSGYRTEYKDGYEGHFKFYEEDTDLTKGTVANKVTMKLSQYTNPYFVYNKETKTYDRYQFKGPHIDATTKKQLTFKNLIVQYVKEWNIDKNGYQTMDIENGTGSGYYITNGKAQKITWKKKESTKKMRYYDEDGNELTMNPGKTFVTIFPVDRENDVVFE